MAEIGRQCRHARSDVPAVAIPTKQRRHAKGVAEVVHPRPARCRGADAAFVEQAGEGGLEHRMAEACPGARQEQRRCARGGAELVTPMAIAAKGIDRGVVEQDLAGLVVMTTSG